MNHPAVAEVRFAFGANWRRYLERLTPQRIGLAEKSLESWLGDVAGMSFLDIGSGSGLFSLAARNLGARVRSFDYDEQSVACTEELRRRFHPGDAEWQVERGSALDEEYVRSLGSFDIVYSWGVLHHTGDMWRALDLATTLVAPRGRLFVALYPRLSPIAHRMVTARKRIYARGSAPVRWTLAGSYAMYAGLLEAGSSIAHGRHPLARILDYHENWRGMSWWHDVVDWVGGYPYESASPGDVVAAARGHGLVLTRLLVHPHNACAEYLFEKAQPAR